MTNPNQELLSWAVENIKEWDDKYTHLRSDGNGVNSLFYTNGLGWWIERQEWRGDDFSEYTIHEEISTLFYSDPPQVITKEEWSNGVLLREHAKIRIACDTVLETPSTSSSEPITGHIHADLMAEYALVAKTNPEPWKEFQQLAIISGSWVDLTSNPLWKEWKEYRRKPTPPKTMNIGGIVVEAWPLEKLTIGQGYYYIKLRPPFVQEIGYHTYNNCAIENYELSSGALFTTKEQAQAVANALNLVYNRAIGKEG